MKRIFIVLICSSFLLACSEAEKKADEPKTTGDTETGKKRDYSIGDDKYCEMAKKSIHALANGNVDEYTNAYADNAVFRWSGGDSLNGKAAIADYWKKRRAEVIDSLSFSSEVWLPVNVEKSMAEGQLTGNYALSWSIVHAKYKSGKSMTQRMHIVYHFNGDDKLDRVTQYLDRVPINAAIGK